MHNCDRLHSPIRGSGAVLIGTLAAVLMAGVWGCGSSGPTGTVSGKLVGEAGPISGAEVLLCRSDGGAVAKATAGPSGEFKFAQPVPVGQYGVQLESSVQEAPPNPDETREPPPKPTFPAKYQNFRTSGLTADVKAGDNVLTFEVK